MNDLFCSVCTIIVVLFQVLHVRAIFNDGEFFEHPGQTEDNDVRYYKYKYRRVI